MTEDTYTSIPGPAEGLFKDRGSRFIAFARPVETEGEVKAFLEGIRREYHDARHVCYAYRLGLRGDVWRANDDGEPSGSAARQILSRIDSAGLSDVLVVVVRYFGGIKLGVPGLINAYRTAAGDALSKAGTAVKTAGKWYRLRFGYPEMPAVMNAVKSMGLPSRSGDFSDECSLEVRVRLSQEENFFAIFEKISNFIVLN